MFASTPDRGRKPVETEEAIRAEFEEFNPYFMLEDEGAATLLAAGEGFGPYTLEWFPVPLTGTHLKAVEELKRIEVLAAMLAFFHGDPSWRESLAWLEVDDPKPGWIERLLNGSLFGSSRSATAQPAREKSAGDDL